MIAWICTDMEGLGGISTWDECYGDGPEYTDYGLRQLTEEVNAAIAGCFDGGATEVRVIDGHGRNRNKGFLLDRFDARATRVWFSQYHPSRFEGLDQTVSLGLMIGQHAMAGTINAFLDHTQIPKTLCRMTVNGMDIGELGQFGIYCGVFGVPLMYVSGDEAGCAEARQQFPHAITTPTKRGTGWATCELYDTTQVRAQIRQDVARAVRAADARFAYRLPPPLTIAVEWAYSELAERYAQIPGVRRPHARIIEWTITDTADIYTWPSEQWHPPNSEV
jgi:D-amino peptidase